MLFVYVKAIAIFDHFNVEMTSCFNVVRNKQHNWGKTIRSYKIYGNRLLISPFSNTQSCKVSCLKLVTRVALITKHKVRHETCLLKLLGTIRSFPLAGKIRSEGSRFL